MPQSGILVKNRELYLYAKIHTATDSATKEKT